MVLCRCQRGDSREVKHCYKLYASVAASGINLMKASMDEKLNLVMTLKATIDKARYIVDNANLYCFLITDCGWKPDYIWEILNSNVKGRDSKSCHQSMEQRICQLKQSSQASSH